jgi:hypothetical protein
MLNGLLTPHFISFVEVETLLIKLAWKHPNKTYPQIGIIRNTHKPIFEIYKFCGLLTLILFTQIFDTYPFLGIDTGLHMSKDMVGYNFSNFIYPWYAQHDILI